MRSAAGTRSQQNADLEFPATANAIAFLKWGQPAFRNFQCVPPDTGIVHQVNLEYLARVVMADEGVRRIPIPWSAPIRTPR